MSPALKKIFLIFTLLAIAGLIAFGLYYVFIREKKPAAFIDDRGSEVTTPSSLPGAGQRGPTSSAPVTTGPGGALPAAGTIPGSFPTVYQPTPVQRVTSDFATYPSINSANGSVRYHNISDGKFYRVTNTGIKELTDQPFYDVKKVTWAKNEDKAVIEFPDNSKIVYNFETKKQTTLPRHWEEFSFSADGGQIAAKSLGLSPENRWLVTTNDDGTGTRLIEPMGQYADRVTVDWSPGQQTVAFSQTGRPLGADRREILFIGLNQENFKSAVVEGQNFLPQWSTTGKKLLYSVNSARSDFKPELWVVNAYGDEIGEGRQELKLNTWADKCAFSDDNTLFCAVPRDLPRGAGMAREIAAGNFDDLYKIDLATGLKTPITLGESDYQINSLSYDKTNNKLMFTDNNQSGIFEVNL